ncbi:NVEALA domain-containing protein [Bacteroides cellulosilyticus]|uniref:NVEALA domain-containing protein n=1 Tax=Bacteroides cellulosilyticus TaxID=246787 RepID=UPI0035655E6B
MKKFMRIAFVAAFAAIAGYGVYTNLKTDVMSDLALANVEALARNEVDQIKCNQAMFSLAEYIRIGGTCVLINNTPIPGEKYN